MPYYAVKVGNNPGIYKTWVECENNIKGFENAIYKKFELETEAIQFLNKINIKEISLQNNHNNNFIIEQPIDLSSCINIYIDGSCINSGNYNAVGSIGIYFSENNPKNEYNKYTSTSYIITNERMEIKAILVAISKTLDEIIDNNSIIIHTDSMQIITMLNTCNINNISEKTKNYDYINKCVCILNKYPNIKLCFTKGILNSNSIHSQGILNTNRLSNIALRNDLNKVVFSFGKYKDKTFGEIYSQDTDYFDWCLLNCKNQINDIQLFLESKND
jgi:ribonuclease HI